LWAGRSRAPQSLLLCFARHELRAAHVTIRIRDLGRAELVVIVATERRVGARRQQRRCHLRVPVGARSVQRRPAVRPGVGGSASVEQAVEVLDVAAEGGSVQAGRCAAGLRRPHGTVGARGAAA